MYSGEAMKKFVQEMQNTKWGKDHLIICGIPEPKKEEKEVK